MKKKIEKNQNLGSFRPIFDFELKRKRSLAEPSRAELKILQLELQFEPARLGLITTTYLFSIIWPIPNVLVLVEQQQRKLIGFQFTRMTKTKLIQGNHEPIPFLRK